MYAGVGFAGAPHTDDASIKWVTQKRSCLLVDGLTPGSRPHHRTVCSLNQPLGHALELAGLDGGHVSGGRRVDGRKGKRGKAPIKYRGPKPGERWSGRGLTPRWLTAYVNGGKKISFDSVRLLAMLAPFYLVIRYGVMPARRRISNESSARVISLTSREFAAGCHG
jgi:hypothetical protein